MQIRGENVKSGKYYLLPGPLEARGHLEYRGIISGIMTGVAHLSLQKSSIV